MNIPDPRGSTNDIMRLDESLLHDAEQSLLRLHSWIRGNGWAGHDPYDVEDWYLQLPRAIRETRILRRLARLPVSAASRYPSLMRRVLGIEQRIYPKAMGLFTQSYVEMSRHFGNREYLQVAEQCARWLLENVSPGYRGYAWGLPIDWQSRIFIPKYMPCGTVSVVCGQGLWDLYEATGSARYLEACQMICEGLIQDHNIDILEDNAICFSYTPLDHFHVHNLNLQVAAFLASIGEAVGKSSYLELARRAAAYALREQEDNGRLPYWGKDQQTRAGRGDHYHAGFEIRALHTLWKVTGESAYWDAVCRYYTYYREAFFDCDGTPWRNPRSDSMVDIHGCAEALICNAQLSNDFPEARGVLRKSLKWTIENMQTAKGYFIYRIVFNKERKRRIDVAYIRWGQACMLCGLTMALTVMRTHDEANTQ